MGLAVLKLLFKATAPSSIPTPLDSNPCILVTVPFGRWGHENSAMVSQRDIAERVGVPLMSVSRALRGIPLRQPGLAEEIRRVAEEMGYRPDPLVQNLVERKRRKQREKGVVVAWLGRGGAKWMKASGADATHPFVRYYRGAQAALDRRGYALHDFGPILAPEGRRVERILRARGVPGVLLGPAVEEAPVPIEQADAFSMVQVGRSRHHPLIDRVANDPFYAMTICMENLTERGYQKIGYYDGLDHNLRSGRRWEAAYLLFQQGRNRINSLFVEENRNFTKERLLRYVRKDGLDAVVSARAIVWEWLQEDPGLRGLGFACPNRESQNTGMPGVEVDYERIGAGAAEFLINNIQSQRRGLVSPAQTLSIRGSWCDG